MKISEEEVIRSQWKKLTLKMERKYTYNDKTSSWGFKLDTGEGEGFFGYSQFREAYKTLKKRGVKDPIGKIAYDLTSKQSKETIQAELKALGIAEDEMRKEANKLKKITTREFYEQNKALIDAKRAELKANGNNSYNANKIIATYFFGSK